MKKVCLFLFSILSILGFTAYAKAESFYEGEYLNEYVKKKNNGVTYYMTMQFIRDSKGDIVYCLEPFTKFEEGKAYTDFEGDLTSYNSLSEAQKRRISLIIYYGYGYGNRTENKWYAITQFMIWREMLPEEDVYFTGSLNGRKVTRYADEMNEIYNDINNHETVPTYQGTHYIDLGLNLWIPEFATDYIITYSDYEYELKNGVTFYGVKDNGRISFTKNSNYYKDKVVIFDSADSQDLIRPGNVINPTYNIDVIVRKGNIRLDIRKDDSVYSAEADLTDTCYEIINSKEERVDYVCTADKELIYDSIDLPFGKYLVRQTSFGKGYLKDENVYNATVGMEPNIVLYNYLLKNNIELTKYACKDSKCSFEENATFQINDKNGKSVDVIKTNQLGKASITLGYGTYIIKQLSGIEGYSLSTDYKEKITDEETKHHKDLFNNYIQEDIVTRNIVEEEPVIEEPVAPPVVETSNEKQEEILEIPNTKTDIHFLWTLPLVIYALKRKFCI